MKYQLRFHTPMGLFTSKVKDDTPEVIREKENMTHPDHSFNVNGIHLTTDKDTIVYLNREILLQSIQETIRL